MPLKIEEEQSRSEKHNSTSIQLLEVLRKGHMATHCYPRPARTRRSPTQPPLRRTDRGAHNKGPAPNAVDEIRYCVAHPMGIMRESTCAPCVEVQAIQHEGPPSPSAMLYKNLKRGRAHTTARYSS
eukprot:IDg17530t1